jgi:hypothetical protein
MLAARIKMTMIMASMALPLNWQSLQRKPSSHITAPPTSSAALVVVIRCGCGIGRGIGARATSSQNWQQHHNPPEFLTARMKTIMRLATRKTKTIPE